MKELLDFPEGSYAFILSTDNLTPGEGLETEGLPTV